MYCQNILSQRQKLDRLETQFREQSLSLAEGRRLVANLYVRGEVRPELLRLYDENLCREIEKRKLENLTVKRQAEREQTHDIK